MAEFTDALFESLMKEESREYTDRPDDPGGPTCRGVTLATAKELGLDLDHDGDVDADDVRLITDPIARQVALKNYWVRYRCHEIADQGLAERYFSIVYNTPLVAGLALQRACRACGVPVHVDGAVGPKTISAVNSIYPPTLLAAFRSEVAGEYRLLVAKGVTPATNREGLENRAYR